MRGSGTRRWRAGPPPAGATAKQAGGDIHFICEWAANPVKVLIVEDDLTYGRLQTLRLLSSKTTRFDSHHVQSLEEALDFLANERVDAALLDLHLPDAEGSAAVRAIHLAHPDLPIVVVTGTLDDEIHAAAKLAGATDIARKGTDSDETMELRLLAAAYRKAYARISQSDPMAPVTRALVADIGLHLQTGEAMVRRIREQIARGETVDQADLDRCLEQVQESLAPMQPTGSDPFELENIDALSVLRKAADHLAVLRVTGNGVLILGDVTTLGRAFGAILKSMPNVSGPIDVECVEEDATFSIHIHADRAPRMKRDHPLLWTMAEELLGMNLGTLQADETGFTLRFVRAEQEEPGGRA